ncbi:MAG: conjugal transfer protein TraX [Synergistaceae bacterium]|jgi:hypothetical protein|nr:conjugal transfer protein TraX [Synergistaceae bacterium]
MSKFEPPISEVSYAGRRFLTGFHLKIIGIALMVFDHIYQMFYAHGAPEWFTWLGRPVASIFLFMCAEGFHYTRSKSRYMLLLFVGFQSMNVISTILTFKMRVEEIALINNIFGTLLVSVIYMLLADMLRQGVREKKARLVFGALFGAMIPVAIGILPFAIDDMPVWLKIAMLKYIPNPISAEGGFFLVTLGVLFHLFRSCRLIQASLPVAIGAMSYFSTPGDAQWMMCFAAIPILLYNGKKGTEGSAGKYFFYIFYPAHIYLLYIIAWMLT